MKNKLVFFCLMLLHHLMNHQSSELEPNTFQKAKDQIFNKNCHFVLFFEEFQPNKFLDRLGQLSKFGGKKYLDRLGQSLQ